MKKILVTGGLGFIGTNLIQRLLKTTDYSIVVLDKFTYAARPDSIFLNGKIKKRLTLIKGDVANKKSVREAMKDISVVIHLAASTHTVSSFKDPANFIKANVIGTSQLLDAASKNSIDKFIYISSSEVYGDRKKGKTMNEDHPLVPVSPYAVTKLAADRLAYSYFLTKKLPIVILRPFNTYGPYQHTEKMIPLFITRLLKNMPIHLHNGGKQTRDWVFVEDHVSAIESVINTKIDKIKGEIFNIGTGESASTREVAELILAALKKNKDLLFVEKSSQPGTMGNVGISRKAQKVLKWKSKVSLEEGIKKTVEWYKKNRSWWDK